MRLMAMAGSAQAAAGRDGGASSRYGAGRRSPLGLGGTVAVHALVVGAFLLFPHAILHEAALTFLGVGLDPSQPAIGVLLADAMRYLSGGYWWLGVFPGLGLLLMVLAIQRLATQLRQAL